MTILSDKPTLSQIGILQPLLQNRWRIKFSNLTLEQANAISAQSVSVDIDLLKKEYKLVVEQPLNDTGAFLETISDMCDLSEFIVKIEAMDGCTEPVGTLLKERVHVKSHKVELNYAKSGVVRHELVLKTGYRKTWAPQAQD